MMVSAIHDPLEKNKPMDLANHAPWGNLGICSITNLRILTPYNDFDRWVGGWMDGLVDGWIGGWMDG
jgi:hypothetical protein